MKKTKICNNCGINVYPNQKNCSKCVDKILFGTIENARKQKITNFSLLLKCLFIVFFSVTLKSCYTPFKAGCLVNNQRTETKKIDSIQKVQNKILICKP